MAMNWEQLLTVKRYGKDPETLSDEGRSNFHKDYDRIVFSGAFRRLQGKTQVHPVPKNDHIHTRLTHSLEVASVGRSLGAAAGIALKEAKLLPHNLYPHDIGAIVQAACLAHDIGNPPFGHAGEYAIRQWFESVDSKYLKYMSPEEEMDIKTFEGNAQGFRVLTQLEYNLFNGGMKLTYPTLGAFLKYPWSSSSIPKEHSGKFGCFQSELPYLSEISDTLGLIPQSKNRWCRHPLAYLVEAADDICYALIDIEDGIELGIVQFAEFEKILKPLCRGTLPQDYNKIPSTSLGRKISRLRGKAMEPLIKNVVDTFVKNQEKILDGTFEGDLIQHCDKWVGSGIKAAKNLAKNKIFKDSRKMQLEIGVYSSMDIMLTAFCDAALEYATYNLDCTKDTSNGKTLSFKTQRIIELMEAIGAAKPTAMYDCYMTVIDYIAGMTDSYASFIARQISGMGR